MPTYLITEAPGDDVKLYISQSPLEAVTSTLQKFWLRDSRFKVWQLKLVSINPELCPKETVPLELVAKIEPHDKLAHHAGLWGFNLDQLPLEQASIEITKMRDYIDQKEREAKMRAQTQETPTTGS